MTDPNDVYIYTINDAKGSRRLACMLPEAVTRQHGLKSFAIVGEFADGTDNTNKFVVNPAFLDFLAWAIARHAAQCPSLIAQAQKHQNGHLYVTDARGRVNGAQSSEADIIGIVAIKDGKIISYAGNKNYLPFNEHGFMTIEPWLNSKIREELLEQVTRTAQAT